MIEARGEIKDGKLVLFNRKRFDADLSETKDCTVTITVKKAGKRSLPSNSYYWGVVIPEIRNEFKNRGERMSAEDVHLFLKLHFAKRYVHDDNGEVIAEIPGSTAEMNQEQFGEYLERIIQWCGEKLCLYIPPPSSQTQLFAA